MKLVEQTPDMGHCWVRYTFRPWPASRDLWLDLFDRGLGRSHARGHDPGVLPGVAGLEDLIYLPPVDPSMEAPRGLLSQQLAASDSPKLAQCLPGRESGLSATVEIYDVLQAVATADFEQLETIPSGAPVVWPLISGYTAEAEQWESGLRRLADAGASCVQGIAADLSPADRRRVVEVAGEHGFDALFHGPGPSERDFARAVHRLGMEPFLERPLPESPSRTVHNRRLSGVLATIGELWLRLGRTESRGQSFYRAARWIDRDNHDLVILAREGNLGVVRWLDDDTRRVVQELADSDESSLLADLRGEYLGSTESL